MKRSVILWSVVVVGIGIVCSWPRNATAGGVAGFPSCLVTNHNGAVTLRGVLAVEVMGNVITGDGTHDVDYTLRLARSGAQHFFRLFLADTQDFGSLSDQERVCRILNPEDTSAEPANQAKVINLVKQILTAFDLPLTWRLVITDSSISNTDSGPSRVIPGTVPPDQFVGRASGLADVTIYAIKP